MRNLALVFVASLLSALVATSAVAAGEYHLAYASDSGIKIVTSQGKTISVTSSSGDSMPSWSADGTRLAYTSYQHGRGQIYVIDVLTLVATRITDHLAADEAPSWSPDGTRIAFVSYRDGNPEIYSMDSDGTNLRNLSNTDGADYNPSWSPDGTQIVFSSDPDKDELHDIFVMDPDGDNKRKLTTTFGAYASPAWSPDGNRIVFYHLTPQSTRLSSVDREGNNLRTEVESTTGSPWGPSWSPDGTTLAFFEGESDTIYFVEDEQTSVKISGGTWPAFRPVLGPLAVDVTGKLAIPWAMLKMPQ